MADETTTTNDSENLTAETSTSTTNAAENNSSTTETTEADGKIDLGKGEDPKTDNDKDDGEKSEDENPLFGAPAEGEAYAIEGLPEGMSIDEAALEAATPVFRELGLSNAGASKVAGLYAEHVLPGVMERAQGQFKENLETQIADQRTAWQDETLKAVKGEVELKTSTGDKIDFGGASVKQVQQSAARAIDRVAPAGFREFLDETGLGQHPAMVAFAYQVGQLVAEDTDAGGGGGPVNEKPTQTQRFYGR